MKTYIPQQIIVPVYYFIDEDEKVQFDFEEMTRFFENELSNICSTDKQINK
jgi:phage pi2 protein 07